MRETRVRFAPSPTGYLHVGGLRTALYNYLFARKNKGTFILRIEDTDQTRYVEGAEEGLIQILQWSGLEYDEGPDIGGPYAPYRQSDRVETYRQYALQLVERGNAYYAFDTQEELEEMRKTQEKRRIPPKYDRRALKLSDAEVKARLSAGEPSVIRMKVPDSCTIVVDDLVRGRVEFSSDQLDDQVLLKSDGFPTYHLANVVDDHLMQISHVIRGEEWLSSTPKHVLLYQFFGWDLPQFAHLPLLLNPDRSKLSKRQGDVAVEAYREKGYLRETLLNFVALLGWNPGDDREIFSLEDLVDAFSLDRVGKSGAVFDVDKLKWMNFTHLRMKSDIEFLAMLKESLVTSGIDRERFSDDYLLQVISVMRDRVSFVGDFVKESGYFFRPPLEFDQSVLKKRWKERTPSHMKSLAEAFSTLLNPQREDYETALKRVAAASNVGPADLIHPLRLAVSGVGAGPGLYDILFILGKEETIARITSAIEKIK